ncbi:MAG: hypothetical protein R3F61_13685 [Myxococcota bacterium]
MDELYVVARRVLLDALEALGPHREAVVVVAAPVVVVGPQAFATGRINCRRRQKQLTLLIHALRLERTGRAYRNPTSRFVVRITRSRASDALGLADEHEIGCGGPAGQVDVHRAAREWFGDATWVSGSRKPGQKERDHGSSHGTFEAFRTAACCAIARWNLQESRFRDRRDVVDLDNWPRVEPTKFDIRHSA